MNNTQQLQRQTATQVFVQQMTQQLDHDLKMNDIFGQTSHEFTIDEKENTESKQVKIVELWLKDEKFEPEFASKLHPDVESILLQKNEKVGEMTEAISIATETYQKAGNGNGPKGLSRVVLVNEYGQRIIDARIKVTNPAQVQGKALSKLLREQSQELAPDIDVIRSFVLSLLKGHRVVGYHLGPKLKEFQIHEEVSQLAHACTSPNDAIPNPFDNAYRFNEEKKQQDSIQQLCHQYLKFQFRRSKNQPSAFTEAKIQMALYKTWKIMNGQNEKSSATSLKQNADNDSKVVTEQKPTTKDQVQVMTGSELKAMIEKMIQEEVDKRMKKMVQNLEKEIE